jgi:hypothetical protein
MTLTTILAAMAVLSGPMDALLDNALQISTDTITYHTYFNADGSYTTDIGITGTWTVEGTEVCVTRSTGEHGCAPLQENVALGDSWTGINAATGDTVTYTVVARD